MTGHYKTLHLYNMKLQVTKAGAAGRKTVRGQGFSVEVTAKTKDIEIPARGFIECKDIKLLVFVNSKKEIVKFELTLGKTKHVFKDDYPFILWSQVENWINIYLSDKREAEEAGPDKLAALGKKRVTKKKTTK